MIKTFKKLFLYAFVIFFVLPIGFAIFLGLNSEKQNNMTSADLPKPIKPIQIPASSKFVRERKPKPDCDKFETHLVKLAPANTGNWEEALNDSKYCLHKTKDSYFKKLVARYELKAKKAKKQAQEEKILLSKIGPKPLGSAAKRFIKEISRDPASVRDVECSTAVPSKKKDAWVQTCNFRGKNAFGGYVKNQITVRIRENVVVGVEK